MKTLLVIFLFCSMSVLHAGFKLGKKVMTMDDHDKVIALSKKKLKPITYMYSNTGTSCGLCSAASHHIMSTFSKKTLFVYVDRKGFAKLPEAVKTAFRSSQAGKYIPKTVITIPGGEEVVSVIPYMRNPKERAKLYKTALSDLKKRAKKGLKKVKKAKKSLKKAAS